MNEWVADNRMVCAGNKTKLMVIATNQLRRSRFRDQNMQVTVCGAEIEDTKSEKLWDLCRTTNCLGRNIFMVRPGDQKTMLGASFYDYLRE